MLASENALAKIMPANIAAEAPKMLDVIALLIWLAEVVLEAPIVDLTIDGYIAPEFVAAEAPVKFTLSICTALGAVAKVVALDPEIAIIAEG